MTCTTNYKYTNTDYWLHKFELEGKTKQYYFSFEKTVKMELAI